MGAPPCTPQPVSEDEEVRCAQPLLGDSSEDDGEVWTPQPASEVESSDNGLPAPSVQEQLPLTSAVSQERGTDTPLPLDPCKCKARTWKRALLPHLPQCSRKPLPGHEFCQAHLTNSPYGRYDNPLDPSVPTVLVDRSDNATFADLLKRDAGGFVLDMTENRHKTSKFVRDTRSTPHPRVPHHTLPTRSMARAS